MTKTTNPPNLFLLTPGELSRLNTRIGHAIDATNPGQCPEAARRLLRERRAVRDEMERRRAAANN